MTTEQELGYNLPFKDAHMVNTKPVSPREQEVQTLQSQNMNESPVSLGPGKAAAANSATVSVPSAPPSALKLHP